MISPLNIAMVAACPFPTSQGSQVLIRELSEALAHRGHNVHVVTYHFGGSQPCPGFEIHRIPELFPYNKFRSGPEIRKPLLDLLLARKLDEVVRRKNIQIIHCHNYEAPVAAFPVRFLRKIPIVYHSHNTMSDEFYTYFRLRIPQALARGAAFLMDKFIPKWADYTIAINRQVAGFLMEMGTPPSRIKFIPPGIDYGAPVESPDQSLRSEFDLGEGPLILYAGNLDGYQRLDLLLDGLPQVFTQYTDAKLVVMTSSDPGPLLDNVARRGFGDNVAVIQNPSFPLTKEIMVLGSLAVNPRISWSGYPIKLLNYMAAGLPVVAFEGAAPPTVHRLNGLLAPAGDSQVFGWHITELLENPDAAREMGEVARETVVRAHDWNNIAGDIEKIYARLLNIEFTDAKESELVSDGTVVSG